MGLYVEIENYLDLDCIVIDEVIIIDVQQNYHHFTLICTTESVALD